MDTQGSSSKRDAEDESDNRNSKKPNIELSEEDNFYELFYEALKLLQKVDEEELTEAVGTVIDNFKYETGKHFSDNDLSIFKNCLAYFKRYAQLNTEVSRSRILEAVNNCKVLQSDIIGNEINVLNVVSIGGGPGFDIIGMLSAFYNKVNCKKLNVTVVDHAENWKSCLEIVESLLREHDFGDACSMFKKSNTSLSFMNKDVCEAGSQNKAYTEVVNNADIIQIVRLLSILKNEKHGVVCRDVVKKMKIGAILLFIDSPTSFFDFKALGLKEIYRKDLEKESYCDFRVKASPEKYLGNIAKTSNAQIVVYKK